MLLPKRLFKGTSKNYLDANIVLRYLLKDNEELYAASCKIIEQMKCLVTLEVFEEIIYVLEKHYKVPREEIYGSFAQKNDTFHNFEMYHLINNFSIL